MSRKAADQVTTIGIDIGKNSFHLIGLDGEGSIVLRRKLSRAQVSVRLANIPPCLIGMEACVGAHHLSRRLLALGHDARLMPAQYVKPYLRGQKNDFRDAEAVAEAVQRPRMRFVPTKSVEQLDLQALHRVRARLVRHRTSVINQIRALLLERGIAVRQGARFLRSALPDILGRETEFLSPRMVRVIADLSGDLHHLDERLDEVTAEIETLAKADDACLRLMTVPGIGPIIASAMVAAIGDGSAFTKGRDFAAWLGLVPRQVSTGGRTILGRISKRGNTYLRTLFIRGAKVLLLRPKNWPRHSFGPWLEAASRRLHRNVLAVALANKLARIAWSVLAGERHYQTNNWRNPPRSARRVERWSNSLLAHPRSGDPNGRNGPICL
jgi:transposase